MDDREPFEHRSGYEKWWMPQGRDWKLPTRGRYKEKFHYNERISQWRMADPDIPEADWRRIVAEASNGKYGPLGQLTRSGVIRITRNLGLQKYRERWKTILNRLNPNYTPEDIPTWALDYCQNVFPDLVERFRYHRDSMPKSISRKSDGSVETKNRHNFPSYNYIQRKILESVGIYDFHAEFPIPRSHEKLHALDDVMEKMMGDLKLNFSRSTVIRRPKIRKRK